MTVSGIFGSKIYIQNKKQESTLAYLDDIVDTRIDSLIGVVQAFQELFDADVDTGEAICVATEEDILDVLEYANRILTDFEVVSEDD